MREILFRGKSDIGNMWVYGYYTKRDNDGDIEHRIETINGAFFRIISETLGQWTGLKDKEGTRIFEGDIVKTKFFGKQIGDAVVADYDKFAVTYETGTFYLENKTRCFPLSYIKEPCSGFEVVGNIYDNPDSTIKSEF